MWHKLLLFGLMLPSLVWADATLAERAAQIRLEKSDRTQELTLDSDSDLTGWMENLRTYQFSAFREQLPRILQLSTDVAVCEPLLTWYLLTEDLAALKQWGTVSSCPFAAEGELALSVLDLTRADSLFRLALDDRTPAHLRLAKVGLSKVLQKQQKYQEALDILVTAWNREQLSDEVIFQAALCKQRLGETSESMDLLEEVLHWNEFHELGHYFLGNGYARKNYTELESSSEYLKCDGTAPCARDFVVDGSAEWMLGEYQAALEHFNEALRLVPDYGRAHNGVAKCLEQIRLRENIYRDADQAAFDAKPFPAIPLIDQYVLNWESLSERHKKQVAISVEPWKDYIPVLVATGSHHYIKPLHEKLSECPGLQTIADQRISYDSRLWDDVRGCGGYTTVTGVEDVERSIYNRYNTVLHELTHQVHGVFPPEDVQRIEELYRESSASDAAGVEIFVSRYQGSSVWEYFAEGMNSYFSPRRNEFDTREITKERLFKLDLKLVQLLEFYMTAPNVEDCYPVGYVNAAQNEVEQGNLNSAMDYAKQAEARAGDSEVVLRALAQISSYKADNGASVDFARKAVRLYPDKAASHAQLAWSLLFQSGSFQSALDVLTQGLSVTSGSEQTQLLRDVAGIQLASGFFDEAVVNYKVVLAKQSTDDDALRGYAEALLWDGQLQAADSVYRVAIKRRSGVAGLRLEYARLLLLSGRTDEARDQINEADLLKPSDGRVMIHRAWLENETGSSATRAPVLAALKQYPDDAIVQAISANLLGENTRQALIAETKSAVPAWVYNPSESAYEARHYWDAPSLKILHNGLSKSSQ